MALFTDGPISCIEDLTAQDSQLLNVASVEGIDMTQKTGNRARRSRDGADGRDATGWIGGPIILADRHSLSWTQW